MPLEVQKYKSILEGRAMLVRKAKVIPLEAIVRGYITGETCNGRIHQFDANAAIGSSF